MNNSKNETKSVTCAFRWIILGIEINDVSSFSVVKLLVGIGGFDSHAEL